MKELIAAFVLLSLFVGCVSQETSGSDEIVVAGGVLSISELSTACGHVEADGHSGIPLDCIVIQAGVDNPEDLSFTLVGSDGYQKTFNWEDMLQGVLTDDGLAVFPHLPKAFWVKDVVEVRYGGG
ncbi:MAG: hypothetical protein JW778_06530 [Candidatus Altiarchaeota archaeon]|nr:hypothetical protein [Candidatus Altiarchaeota archaeon]